MSTKYNTMREALKEADEYLSNNRLNSIGSGSILHRQFRDALALNEDTVCKTSGYVAPAGYQAADLPPYNDEAEEQIAKDIQEIEWLKQEIADDESLRGTSSFSDVEDRLEANSRKLEELQVALSSMRVSPNPPVCPDCGKTATWNKHDAGDRDTPPIRSFWGCDDCGTEVDVLLPKEEKDGCVFCLGNKGGVKGNENVIGGRLVCDFCTSLLMDMKLDVSSTTNRDTHE